MLALALAGQLAGGGAAETVLTWEECIRRAAAANPSLTAARARVAAASAGTRVARADLLPQFTLNGNAARSDRDTQGQNTALSVAAQVTQSLYSGGKNRANLRLANAALNQTESAALETAAEVTYRLRAAFIALLYAQEQTNLLHTVHDRRAENLEMVDLRYTGGVEHKGSLALSQASLQEATTDLEQAGREVGVAAEVLRRVIGDATANAGRWAATGTQELQAAPGAAICDELVRATPEYCQALAVADAARATLDAARAGFQPGVDLTGSLGRQGDENTFNDDGWSVGVSLTLPLWPGGRNYHNYTQARAKLAEAEAQLAETANALYSELTEVLRNYRNAVEDIAVRRKYLEASQLQAEIAREQYANGLLGFENWDTIENNLITAAKQMLETNHAARAAEAAWWRATGVNAFAAADVIY